MAQIVQTDSLEPNGFETIAGAAASTALTVPTGSTKALISVEDQDVRYRDDGIAPTSSVGILLQAGREKFYEGGVAGLAAFRLIELSASTEVNVLYYK